MRRLLICLLAIGIVMPVIGQTPKYKIPPVLPLLQAPKIMLQQNGGNLGIHPQRFQVIYYAQDFPAAPSGNMKNVYFRYGRRGTVTPGPTIYYDLIVKIGHTQRMTWKGGSQLDTFESELSTVHVSPAYTYDFNQDTQGSWFRLPVNAGNFYYNGTNNFVV